MVHGTADGSPAITDGEVPLVDCDVHQSWGSEEELRQYLPPEFDRYGVNLPSLLYNNPGGVMREDATPADADRPGTTPENVREEHLDPYGVDYAILTGHATNLALLPNRDYAAALARAYNRWVREDWLPADDRLRGSVLVPPQAPDVAAELIREFGDDDRFVQVLMDSASPRPYGQSFYWPIYEAAAEVGIPVAMHPHHDGHGISNPPTGAGYPGSYFEWHNVLPAVTMGQLNSLVTEGVFVEYPDLDVVCIEGGFGWVPHLMWRMDKNWKGLRSQAPWLDRPPSDYVIENVWFTSQPVEEPERPEHLRQILEMMHADRTLLFSSDFPHWDGDSPEHGFPPLDDDLEERIFGANACELYDLPR